MNLGKFIVLEGGEGMGKTTQIARLKESLPILYPEREFVFTREPGGTPFATKIRELILSDDARHASGRTMLGLFMAARADHVSELITPALADDKVVVCDRYLAATYAYQVIAQEDPLLEELFWVHTKLMPAPDLTLLFDMEPGDALSRVATRAGEVTHFDARDLSFHERIRHGFDTYFSKAEKSRFTRIDAARSIEEVETELLAAMRSLLVQS